MERRTCKSYQRRVTRQRYTFSSGLCGSPKLSDDNAERREDKLGTLAIAVPKPKDLIGSVTSSVLLGDKNVITARMFAELVASKKGKIAMVSIYLEKMGEMQAQAFFMRLIDKVIKGEGKKEPEAI